MNTKIVILTEFLYYILLHLGNCAHIYKKNPELSKMGEKRKEEKTYL